jgi:cytochrome aa3-600 menaquinol oxidase subunit 2
LKGRKGALAVAAATLATVASGCGAHYVLLHPVGPVARRELHVMAFAAITMGAVALAIFVLFGITIYRYLDRPGNPHPYWPDWTHDRFLEVLWFIAPVLILAVIAVPTVESTYALSSVPVPKPAAPRHHPLVVDVTSLTWKWLFQYPKQHVATVNYLEIPTGRPVLFELTANSAMNTFWIPRLGGMEYTMPGRVLPLWLEADRPGTYWGRSGQYSGRLFEKMSFTVRAVPSRRFQAWMATVRRTRPALTTADYRRLLDFGTAKPAMYSSYPQGSFPSISHAFSLIGGMYHPWQYRPNLYKRGI